jgi:hypothetical protein
VKRSSRKADPKPRAASRWSFRRREQEPAVAELKVAEMVPEGPLAREWNIWELERMARAQSGGLARDQEWAALFMHLRQFANADGVLPAQFDDLVRESFSRLIQAA